MQPQASPHTLCRNAFRRKTLKHRCQIQQPPHAYPSQPQTARRSLPPVQRWWQQCQLHRQMRMQTSLRMQNRFAAVSTPLSSSSSSFSSSSGNSKWQATHSRSHGELRCNQTGSGPFQSKQRSRALVRTGSTASSGTCRKEVWRTGTENRERHAEEGVVTRMDRDRDKARIGSTRDQSLNCALPACCCTRLAGCIVDKVVVVVSLYT